MDKKTNVHFAFFGFYILNFRMKLQLHLDFRYDHNGSDKIRTKDRKVWCYEMSNKISVVPM